MTKPSLYIKIMAMELKTRLEKTKLELAKSHADLNIVQLDLEQDILEFLSPDDLSNARMIISLIRNTYEKQKETVPTLTGLFSPSQKGQVISNPPQLENFYRNLLLYNNLQSAQLAFEDRVKRQKEIAAEEASHVTGIKILQARNDTALIFEEGKNIDLQIYEEKELKSRGLGVLIKSFFDKKFQEVRKFYKIYTAQNSTSPFADIQNLTLKKEELEKFRIDAMGEKSQLSREEYEITSFLNHFSGTNMKGICIAILNSIKIPDFLNVIKVNPHISDDFKHRAEEFAFYYHQSKALEKESHFIVRLMKLEDATASGNPGGREERELKLSLGREVLNQIDIARKEQENISPLDKVRAEQNFTNLLEQEIIEYSLFLGRQNQQERGREGREFDLGR